MQSDLPVYYQRYLDLVEYTNLPQALILGGNEMLDFIHSIPEKSADYAYAPGKWTIKEVISHMIDAERVFAYRALRFSRNDKTEIEGFDENAWAPESNAKSRRLYKIAGEYANVRAASVDLFSSFNDDMLARTGVANGLEMQVSTLGFLIAGHERHHLNIVKERYFS